MNLIHKLQQLVHKPGVNKDDWNKVHPNLLVVADYLLSHCDTYNLPIVVSSIIRPKIKGVSVSKTHQEGRAFDISVKGWSENDVEYLVDAINEKLTVGAISFFDAQEREALYEPTVIDEIGRIVKVAHLHFQVRK